MNRIKIKFNKYKNNIVFLYNLHNNIWYLKNNKKNKKNKVNKINNKYLKYLDTIQEIIYLKRKNSKFNKLMMIKKPILLNNKK